MLMRRKRPLCLSWAALLLRQRMGRSASARAKELFAEDVVMNQYEELFDELEQRRLAAPAEARSEETYASKYGSSACLSGLSQPSMAIFCRDRNPSASLESLPKSLCEARGPLWRLLDESIPADLKHDLHEDLLEKTFLIYLMKFPLLVRLRHWFIISRWQKWLFPVVCCIPYAG